MNHNNAISEWTMTYVGQFQNVTYRAWRIDYTGRSIYIDITDNRVIRTTFYLKSNVYITNPNATGTSTDPFILYY